MSGTALRRILALGALAGFAGCAAAILLLRALLLEPLDPSATTVVFSVPTGASLREVARAAEGAGIVRSALGFECLARWRGDAGRLHAGEYELSAALTPGEILAMITSGRVKAYDVALPEGLTASEIAARLERAGVADAGAFLAVVHDPGAAAAFGVEGPGLEGYLFPETYRIPRGLPPRELAARLVGEFQRVWQPLAPKAAARGLTMRQVVTLASIVEKETGAAEERPRIAAVFHNRLARGMRLESDPTVIYGIGDFDGNLRRMHLESETNPYNTYRIAGLPPGPIASPGAESLRAVLEPAQSDELYFVSRNDGTHDFSRSYAEHLRAVSRFQKRGPR